MSSTDPRAVPEQARRGRMPARLALLLIAFLTMSGAALAADERPPDIIVVIADDHGLDAIGAYGRTAARTPNLDRLAREGVRFERAFATASSCSPSRAVLLSGLHAHANGMYGLEHDVHNSRSFDSVRSLPVRLKTAGYRTARVGKYHVAPERVYAFDEDLNAGAEDSRNPVRMAEKAEAFLRRAEEPVFLWFATSDPHRSTPVPPPAPNPFGNHEVHPGVREIDVRPADVAVPSYLPDTPEVRVELANYLEAASRLDQGVGRLLRALADAGRLDNAVILFLSDNGSAFPGAKTTVYDPGVRLPLIVRAPGLKRGDGVRRSMVSWVDLAPTLLDYAGVASGSGEFQGRSFRQVVQEGDRPGWDKIYASQIYHEAQMYYPMRAVRTDRYKLIWNIASPLRFPMAADLLRSSSWRSITALPRPRLGRRPVEAFLQRPPFELYDMRADPDELVNLADDPGHAAVLAALKADLKAFQARTRDPWLSKWDYE